MRKKITWSIYSLIFIICFAQPCFASRAGSISKLVKGLKAARSASTHVSSELNSLWFRGETPWFLTKQRHNSFDQKHIARIEGFFKEIVTNPDFKKVATEKMAVILSETASLPNKIRAYYDIAYAASEARAGMGATLAVKEASSLTEDLVTYPIRKILAKEFTDKFPGLKKAKLIIGHGYRNFRVHRAEDFYEIPIRDEVGAFLEDDLTTLLIGRLWRTVVMNEGHAILPLKHNPLTRYDDILEIDQQKLVAQLSESDRSIQSYSDVVDTVFTGLAGLVKVSSELRLAISNQQAGFSDFYNIRQLSQERASVVFQFHRNIFTMSFENVNADVVDRVSRAFFDVNRLADTLVVHGRDFYTSNERVVKFLNKLPLQDRLRVIDSREFESFARHRRGLMAELEANLSLN